jgi:hypothetical protein
MRSICLLLAIFVGIGLQFTILNAQGAHPHAHNRAIHFPDVAGYKTLVCDFHQHTVFSDGSVWPDIRVEEALRDSVDAISLTEHLEYQPHSKDIPHPDRNRSFEVATQSALPYNLMVIKGAEITRRMPPGHSNAIFIQDANKLLIEDSLAVFEEANRQGAFTFWNHPNWIAQYRDGIARMTPFHQELVQKRLLHGVEVVNDLTYSDEALQIALDYNLTIMATSDVHGLVDWQYKVAEGGHRPVTLVLARERTPESIREALFERRTIGWFNNTLVGRPEQLMPLIEASLQVTKAEYQGISSVLDITISNDSDVEYLLINRSAYNFHDDMGIVRLNPNGETTFSVKTLAQVSELQLQFEVANAVTAPRIHPLLSLPVKVIIK